MVRRAMDSIATIGVNLGLIHPVFDPHAVEGMPFRRPATVVADTSGVTQGGLSFVARYLHPTARVKVPAIVHMEIVNFAERFFSNRRDATPRRADLFIDHMRSQAAQRVLLRLELHSPTEIERTFLLGDPLRSAFQRDSDPELSGLNISGIIGAYADRLILEACRHHQAQASPGHPIHLLTSDQGFARMALAEGLNPMFFRSVAAADFFGKQLTGALFHPFSGELQSVPMTGVLWELATAFGSVRLSSADGAIISVVAIGTDLSWSPYQSRADLLWTDIANVPEWPDGHEPSAERKPSHPWTDQKKRGKSLREGTKSALRRRPGTSSPVPTSASVPRLRFNVGKLFTLIDALDDAQAMSEDDAARVVGAKNRDGVEDFRRFLGSAGAITVREGTWIVEPVLRGLAVSLRTRDIAGLREHLSNAPSYLYLRTTLERQPIGIPWDIDELKRAATTYGTLAEVTCLGCPIVGQGFYSTPLQPDPHSFAAIAIKRFQELAHGERLVATGAWLESLVTTDGIHPEQAQSLLNEASGLKLLRRSTEGSTTELRFGGHAIQVLRLTDGHPIVLTVHLYRGDYLIPGASSSSLRIEERQP